MQSGLVCLELVAKLNQVPLDARALVREYGLTDEEVTEISQYGIDLFFNLESYLAKNGQPHSA